MNDKGKTVNGISKIDSGYRRIVRGKDSGRYVDISMRLRLAGESTEPRGYEGTMRLIETVTDRVIYAVDKEFLP